MVADALLAAKRNVIGFTDAAPALHGARVLGLPVFGDDGILASYDPASIELAMGTGSVRVSPLRRQLFERLKMTGYSFTTVVHPSATLGRDIVLGEGCQIMAGAVIQAGSRLGLNVLVNTRAAVDHDCRIGDHAQIGPGAVLCGAVVIGGDSFIGAGASVIQGTCIGNGVQVGIGAAVLRHCADGSTVVGVPAKETPR